MHFYHNFLLFVLCFFLLVCVESVGCRRHGGGGRSHGGGGRSHGGGGRSHGGGGSRSHGGGSRSHGYSGHRASSNGHYSGSHHSSSTFRGSSLPYSSSYQQRNTGPRSNPSSKIPPFMRPPAVRQAFSNHQRLSSQLPSDSFNPSVTGIIRKSNVNRFTETRRDTFMPLPPRNVVGRPASSLSKTRIINNKQENIVLESRPLRVDFRPSYSYYENGPYIGRRPFLYRPSVYNEYNFIQDGPPYYGYGYGYDYYGGGPEYYPGPGGPPPPYFQGRPPPPPYPDIYDEGPYHAAAVNETALTPSQSGPNVNSTVPAVNDKEENQIQSLDQTLETTPLINLNDKQNATYNNGTIMLALSDEIDHGLGSKNVSVHLNSEGTSTYNQPIILQILTETGRKYHIILPKV